MSLLPQTSSLAAHRAAPDGSRPARHLLIAMLLVFCSRPAVVGAQAPGTPSDPPSVDQAIAEPVVIDPAILLLPAHEGEVWVELTPRDARVAPRILVSRGELDDGIRRLDTGLAELQVLLCRGGDNLGTACEETLLGAGSSTLLGLPAGSTVSGTLYLDGAALTGARISAVPAELAVEVPFLVPLAFAGGELERAVTSAEDGSFRLAAIAAGRYFLEVELPGGARHRTPVLDLPSAAEVSRGEGRTAEGAPLWELGAIELSGGGTVEVLASDGAGEALAGVEARILQGASASDLATFDGETDDEGRLEIRGVDFQRSGEVTCRQRGRIPWRQTFELLPARVECVLPHVAMVTGRVLTGEEEAVTTGASVVLRPVADGRDRHVSAVDEEGRFVFDGLLAGEHELLAGAPGFGGLRRSFTLEAGEILDLGDLVLLPGLTLDGTVVDAGTGEPIADVEIVALEPPGVIRTTTGADGTFTLVGGEEPLLLSLRGPRHAERRVAVSAQRFESGEELRIELAAGGFVEVVIVDGAEGRPCADCVVRVSPGEVELWTDARGVARSRALRPGTYRISRPRIVHLGSTVVEEAEAESRRAEVRAAEVTRVVFGEERRPIRVRLVPPPGAGSVLSARAGERVERLQPEADGSFVVAHRPGEALLLRLHRWNAIGAGESFTAVATLPAVVEGDEWVVRLPATRVEAEIRDASGEAAPGQRVTLRSWVHGNVEAAVAFSDAEGEVLVEHLLPGVYVFYLADRPVQNLSLWEGGSLDLMSFTLPFARTAPQSP